MNYIFYDYEVEYQPSDEEPEKPMGDQRYKNTMKHCKKLEKEIIQQLPEPKNAEEKKQRDAELTKQLNERFLEDCNEDTHRRFINEYKFRNEVPQKEELLNFSHEQDRMTKQARAEWLHRNHPKKPWEKLQTSELKEAEKCVASRVEQLLRISFPRRYDAVTQFVRNKNGAEW